MTTFQAKRLNIKTYLLGQFAFAIALFIIFLIGELYSPKNSHSDTFYLIIGIIVLATIIFGLFKRRLYEITFDNQKMEVTFLFQDFISRQERRVLPYASASFVIDDDSSILRWFRKSLTIYFLKNKRPICEINNIRNAFSYQDLKQISILTEQINMANKSV